MSSGLPPTVKRLGVVSFLTDASSEMIYPLLPDFVTRVLGGGPAFLGLIEGAAETVASLLKIVSGRLSDRLPRRKPLVVAGYGLSSVMRPLMALARAPWHVLAIRTADRIGKGTRSAPRDALLAQVTPASQRGAAYGFHRALDNAGAMVGPLVASGLLAWPLPLRTVFALAAVPGALSLLVLLFAVHEEPRAAVPAHRPGTRDGASDQGAALGGGLKAYLAVLALFTLGNSSDAFLLLRAREAGVSLAAVPLLWAAHHLVKSALGVAGGKLSDRRGRKAVLVAGWAVYALAYAGFALAQRPWHVWLVFGLYGFYFALTEGAERALVADLAGSAATGRAFGLFHAITGAMLLPASLLTGWLWQRAGAPAALLTGAALATVASLCLVAFVPAPTGTRGTSAPAPGGSGNDPSPVP